jgi:hypothetical protein
MSLRAALLIACGALAPVSALAAPGGDVARARTLDQQGVRAYREERYNDAIRFFEEARRLGGPPSEIWNVAKCHVRLDEPEEAAKSIEEYLALRGLSPADRVEADQQLRELQHRHSTLTVTSSPPGASVYLEGHRWAGVTPATIDVPPGEHKVTVEQAGYEPSERSITAKYGRAVIVDAPLERSSSAPSVVPPPAPRAAEVPAVGARRAQPHRLVLGAAIGVELPRFGSVGGGAAAAAFLSAAYVAVDASRLVVTLGARASLVGDTWGNTIGAPSTATNCGAAIPTEESATAFSAFLDGGAAWRATPRWRLGGDLGLGIATYAISEGGGDLFVPTCRPSPGVKPVLRLGLEASYSISRELRLVLAPFMLEVQPAFDGARSTPKDASGAWLRFAAGLGLAFDLL